MNVLCCLRLHRRRDQAPNSPAEHRETTPTATYKKGIRAPGSHCNFFGRRPIDSSDIRLSTDANLPTKTQSDIEKKKTEQQTTTKHRALKRLNTHNTPDPPPSPLPPYFHSTYRVQSPDPLFCRAAPERVDHVLVIAPLLLRLHRVRLHANEGHVHGGADGHGDGPGAHAAQGLHPERDLGALVSLQNKQKNETKQRKYEKMRGSSLADFSAEVVPVTKGISTKRGKGRTFMVAIMISAAMTHLDTHPPSSFCDYWP